MAKRVSTRRIGKHRHYQYYEAADALGVSAQTLRKWRTLGLPVMTATRPHIILGEDLIAFAKDRQKPSNPMACDEFRCFTCTVHVRALDRVVFYVPYTPVRGQLECFCEVCERPCRKFAGEKSLTELAQFFEIVRDNPSQG